MQPFLTYIWDPFLNAIFTVLLYLANFTHDWGVAIVLLTVLFRLLVMPLTWKQTKSMFEMQRIQPKIKEIQEKYKDNKEVQQEEVMKFYQENKVNPLGGCLPALLQMPLFIALYSVLGNRQNHPGQMLQYFSKLPPELKAQAVKFWVLVPDITKSPMQVFQASGLLAVIPYAILVILFGLSIWLPQQLMTTDKQQKQIGLTMAVVFLYFGWISPAGVLIYWVTSSAIGLGQQQYQLKTLKAAQAREEAEAAAAKQAEKAAKARSRSLPANSQEGDLVGEGQAKQSARRKRKK